MRVLGIEGTAWAASAAMYDDKTDQVTMETDAYQPDTGGLEPTDAAEHMAGALPPVLETVLSEAESIDAVAFSRGPGLGPCLRVTAAVARTAAQQLSVPLIGVNHMIAHLEVGRIRGGLRDPIGLNASGANAHVLGYRHGRYRILGETMDTGVGNAIDKFTRHLGWKHPGGPKVEQHAMDGSYVDLPYVVKGMDFSFAGLASAAQAAVDDGTPVEDVCRGLEETIFAMLTEVTERALSLTHRDEVVLGGGVAQNERLQSMVREMARNRDATVYVPPDRFLRDNAGMIAMTGAEMLAAGETVDIDDSTVRSDFRPDEVTIAWRTEPQPPPQDEQGPIQGAEAIITRADNRVIKRRRGKAYRHPDLDSELCRRRTIREARLLHRARRCGVPTPVVFDVDPQTATIVLERVGETDLRESVTTKRVQRVGELLAHLHHRGGIVHGDPTVRNVRIGDDRLYVIDFGLGFRSDHIEDHAMDLHVFLQSLQDVVTDRAPFREALLAGYHDIAPRTIDDQLAAIEGRGRYQ